MIIVGLTGSIAMGKSTACAMLRHMGIPVHDSDAAVHRIYKEDIDFISAVAPLFPEVVSGKKRTINRQKLGAIIFQVPEKRQRLEQLLHPKVRKSQNDFLRQCRRAGQKLVVLDIPLLYETGAEKRLDAVMVVTAPPDIQRRRALVRPGMTQEKFAAILATQMSDSEKRARADYLIHSGLGRKKMYQDLQDALRKISAA